MSDDEDDFVNGIALPSNGVNETRWWMNRLVSNQFEKNNTEIVTFWRTYVVIWYCHWRSIQQRATNDNSTNKWGKKIWRYLCGNCAAMFHTQRTELHRHRIIRYAFVFSLDSLFIFIFHFFFFRFAKSSQWRWWSVSEEHAMLRWHSSHRETQLPFCIVEPHHPRCF